MIGQEIKVKGRIFVPIQPYEAGDGDVVRYFRDGWRTSFACGRRGGKAAAVRVRDAVGAVRWIELRNVTGAWRRRTRGETT